MVATTVLEGIGVVEMDGIEAKEDDTEGRGPRNVLEGPTVAGKFKN